jgi:predicted P-loop ATPase
MTGDPRTSLLTGTVNPGGGYLSDMTGNRRFWPAKTEKIDIAALTADRDQLWAEAAQYERDGASIILPQHLWAAAAAEQAERQIDDPWVDELEEYLADNHGRVTSSELLAYLRVTGAQNNQVAAKRLRAVMAKLEWVYSRSMRVDGGPPRAGYERANVGC